MSAGHVRLYGDTMAEPTTTAPFGPGLFSFLADLRANNNREWFRSRSPLSTRSRHASRKSAPTSASTRRPGSTHSPGRAPSRRHRPSRGYETGHQREHVRSRGGTADTRIEGPLCMFLFSALTAARCFDVHADSAVA